MRAATIVSSNSKSSEWYSTPNTKRARKNVMVNLSEEERVFADTFVEAYGRPRSRIFAAALLVFAKASHEEKLAALLEADSETPPPKKSKKPHAQ